MNHNLITLTQALESLLKTRIKQNFVHNSFDIHFDHNSISRLDDALRDIGLTAYGMSYTESEICITLQFSYDLTVQCENNLFHYCQFSLVNSGNFDIALDNDALEETWHVKLNTSYDQHLHSVATTEEIDEALKRLWFAFQSKLLPVTTHNLVTTNSN